jgi:hypothetical protein
MKINDLKRMLKKNRFIFFMYKKMTDPDYRSNYRDYITGNRSKPKEKVEKEMRQIKEFWKCDPMHYFRYRLYEKDLTYDELIDYVPAYYFYNCHMDSLYGDSDLSITESKILMRDFFLQKGIRTPESIAVIRKGVIQGINGEKISFGQLANLIRSSAVRTYFVKPDKGRGGKGIFTIRKSGGKLYEGNNEVDEKYFMSRIDDKDFLVQEGVIQRDDLSAMNASSVNTLRVVTQLINNSFRISVVIIRIGRNNSFVDNSAQGGLSVNVDIETGALAKYAFTEHNMEKFDRHPDTNFVFEGFVLRGWDQIRQSILEFARKTPEFPEIAWDIVLQKDGISAIEININYGIDHLQCCTGGMRRRLNISPVLVGNTIR